ncbi:FKBP-type peptidyl-prolyl cis-trans isomerase [Lachnoclostridium phytofermentans]|uniref:peptidylprolyl isomerase n=1 Tax=Lachnoclostridium phytofermentans (strain ATCC 700394 / DSM 18823 / ISDg) TaxID=357809 RepID=A9KJY2_LACP7|nr:FKBP-type peptidyl-prolyl cis-trans isomerase [Lachnoclostridium phytofermentans]ABX41137.1 peptidylprolyl isomerase FKBP-type [Lachnoclostridium phytofermentans ISDg]
MKKRGILAIALLGVTLVFSGCKKNEEINFETYSRYKDVDTTKYVTLGSYKDIKVSVDTFEVTDTDIGKKIHEVQLQNSTYVKNDDRPISKGDKVTVQMTGTIDGKENDGFKSDNFEFIYGNGEYVMDGFTDNLAGMYAGETTKFSITIPNTFSEKAFIGKEASFQVLIKSVEQLVMPEINDEFVQKISDSKTVAEYKEGLVPTIKQEKLEEIKKDKKTGAWKIVSDASEISGYPEGAVENKSKELEEKLKIMAMVQNMELKDYLNTYYGVTFEEYVKLVLKQEMLLDAIGRAENITLSEKEYKESLTEYAKKYGYNNNEEFLKAFGEETVKEALLWDKVQAFIAEQITIEE